MGTAPIVELARACGLHPRLWLLLKSNVRAAVQHARGTNDKGKTFVQIIAITTLVSLAPEGDAPSERGADNAKVVSSTLTRTTKLYFYFFVTWIKKTF